MASSKSSSQEPAPKSDAAAPITEALRGRFIVFDGPDGGGKSTQRELMAERLRAAGVAVTCCRDPGGTEIGDRIRSVLLDHDLSTMDVHCETLLFMASRAQLVGEVIRPALDRGDAVLCDRFVSSTCAYQGAAGYDPRRVIELARFAIDDLWPELTLVFDVGVEEGFERIGRKPSRSGVHRQKDAGNATLFEDAVQDAMESRPVEFHRRVSRNFKALAEIYPTPLVVIDGSGSEQDVHARVVEALARVIG